MKSKYDESTSGAHAPTRLKNPLDSENLTWGGGRRADRYALCHRKSLN
jgi:hypothetical protein